MWRATLIGFLCVTLAFMGLSGIHRHLSVGYAHDAAAASTASAVHLVSALSSDHFDSHQSHGDIDIEPDLKAFGKLSLVQLFFAVAFVCGLTGWLFKAPLLVVRRAAPARPPKNRLRFTLLPPSHAPPVTAFAR